ncbi:hypothetical protein CKA32_001154 [Geitlerinema sp. FC II]|nr:hypothetical protein CKA32_001154 [Geitlerinema sp. FC II]
MKARVTAPYALISPFPLLPLSPSPSLPFPIYHGDRQKLFEERTSFMQCDRWSSVILSLLVLAAPATAASISSEPRQLAQIELDPLCRQVYRDVENGLSIHVEPSPFSRAIANVAPNERLRLADNYRAIQGPEGQNWIPVTFPADGYVNNGFPNGRSNLVLCQPFVWGDVEQPQPPRPQPRPPVSGTTCRRVLVEEGLVVRSAPSTASAIVGGVGANEEIFVPLPLTSIVGDEGRSWVEIVSPLRGYVSSGYPNDGSNLGACF